MITRKGLWAIIGGLAALGLGCANDGARQFERTERSLRDAGDADSLASAALMTQGPDADARERLALIARAVASAPQRPDLVWLNLRLCAQLADCDTAPLEARLRELDPSNAAAWIDAIGRAVQRKDAVALRAGLAVMAASARFDLYWNTTVVHVAKAMLKTHGMPPSPALLTTIGVAAATVIPAYQPIAKSCKGDALDDPGVLASCRRMAAVMRAGDTYVTELIGIGIAMRVWPEGSPEYLDALAAKRVAHYRMETDGELGVNLSSSSQAAMRRLALMAEKRTEQEVGLADIAAVKASPDPPAGYIEKWGG